MHSLTHDTPHPAHAVYTALTHPDIARFWLGTRNRLDVRAGGTLFYGWPDGAWAVWSLREAVPAARLSGQWHAAGLAAPVGLSLDLSAHGDGTRITLTLTDAPADLSAQWQAWLADLDALLATGEDPRRMRRPLMGVHLEDLTPENRARLHTPAAHGLVIVSTVEGGSAEAAGLRAYDVLTHLNDTPIHHFNDISAVMSGCTAGQVIPFGYARGQALHTGQMTLRARPIPPPVPEFEALAAQLAQTVGEVCAELDETVRGASEAELAHSPAPSEWSARETLAHCLFTERFYSVSAWAVAGGAPEVAWTSNMPMQYVGILAQYPETAALVEALKASLREHVGEWHALPPEVRADRALYQRVAPFYLDAGSHIREHLPQLRDAIASARG